MDKQDWSPEPWEASHPQMGYGPYERAINAADGSFVCRFKSSDESVANAIRIAACVNACAGVPTEVLDYMRNKVEKLGLITLPQEATDDN